MSNFALSSSVIGVDVGGTFTDLVLIDTKGNTRIAKVASTPDDYAKGILEGLSDILSSGSIAVSSVDEILHGTTVATNAVLEGKGANVGLLTTAGFRHVLGFGRMKVGELYNLLYEKPRPLVELVRIQEIGERIDSDGNVRKKIDLDQAWTAIEDLVQAGVESVAICLINSWANGLHESDLDELAAKAGIKYRSMSSNLVPVIGEFERTSTTVVNAYVQPLVAEYLESLVSGCRNSGFGANVLVMQSNGGLMSVDRAVERPAALMESGPAAGVIGAAAIARTSGIDNAISFDMGGTTAKASLIEEGQVTVISDYEVGGEMSKSTDLLGGSGYALKIPAVDIAEVGAGGGSIVWIDKGGAMQVGPESAGAVPGPACYGRGGKKTTVTDANVALGYINPESIAGGSLSIDHAAAVSVVQNDVGLPLDLELEEAAWTIHVVATVKMMSAIRAVSSERGRDPREFALIAFGGSGPIHAANLADMLGIAQIVIPPSPGVLSAMGLTGASRVHQYVRSARVTDDHEAVGLIKPAANDLLEQSVNEFRTEGASESELRHSWAVGVRYAGQGDALTIDADELPSSEDQMTTIRERFEAEHKKTYGHNFGSGKVEFVSLRLTTRWINDRHINPNSPADGLNETPEVSLTGDEGGAGVRQLFFGERGWWSVPIGSRYSIGTSPLNGPLIIEELDSTTIVPPDWVIRRDNHDNLILVRTEGIS